MLKDEINLMLSSLIANKKAFKEFYKTGYFSYSKDKPFKGAVAMVNDKAIVSFLQDLDNESEVIATASFQDNTTIIIQLMGGIFHELSSEKYLIDAVQIENLLLVIYLYYVVIVLKLKKN